MKPSAAVPRRLRSTRDLRALQRAMAAAIMRPLTPRDRTQRRWIDGRPAAEFAAQFIKPSDRLNPLERLEIYNRMYWFRLLDCLGDDCPGLRAVLGERRFRRLAEAYLARYPSRSFTLRNLPGRLERFVGERPELTAPHTALAREMARFEWAQVEAFDGPAHPALAPEAIASVPPTRLRLGLQPYLSVLALNHAVDDYVLAVKKSALRTDASNAPDAVRSAPRPRRIRRPRRGRIYLAVHRHHNDLYYKRLDPAAYRLLGELRAGRTLAEACARALPRRAANSAVWQRRVRDWFQNWAALGWFCRR